MFSIKETGKYGKGVYAAKLIQKGTVIHTLSGERMTLNDLVEKVLSNKENIDDPFQIGKRTYIDLDAVSRTFNHSCEPSAGIRKNSELFALRTIQKGDEITYDYSATISPTKWSMRCLCGSKRCRKTLGDVRTIPKRQLAEYWQSGALQRYMKGILKDIENNVYEVPAYELQALKKLNEKK